MWDDRLPHASYRFETQGQRLADLHGARHDLHTVLAICRQVNLERVRVDGRRAQLEAHYGPFNWFDHWIIELGYVSELLFAGAIRYFRLFKHGRRERIPKEWVNGLSADLQESHRYFEALRDKYIVHSVSVLEANTTFVHTRLAEQGQEVVDYVDVGTSRYMPTDVDAIRLEALASALLKSVENEYQNEMAHVLRVAKEMPLDELKALGSKRMTAVEPALGVFLQRAGSPRKRVGEQ